MFACSEWAAKAERVLSKRPAMEPRSGIGVIVNPYARRHRGDPAVARRLARICGDRGVVVEPRGFPSMLRVAEDFRRQRIDVLGIGGGDGSTAYVLTAFDRVYGEEPLPKIALLRGGTMNTIANAIGVPREGPPRLLELLLARHAEGRELESSRRCAMRAGDRLGFLFGTGISHGFLEEYYSRGNPPTPVTAARTLGAIAGSILARGEIAHRVAAPVETVLTVDGERWPLTPYLGVMMGMVEQAGLGFRPFFRAGEGVDAIHLVAIHGSPSAVLARLWRVRLGRALGEAAATERLARRIELACPVGRVRHFLDGDLHETESPLTVTVGPRVRFVWG